MSGNFYDLRSTIHKISTFIYDTPGCSAMSTAQHNPAQFGAETEDIHKLITTIATIDAQIMAGNGLRVSSVFRADF